jgi:protein-tyrosine-phosphatase
MRTILFVCTANICRSPMAEGLFRKRVQDEAEKWRISSAGLYAQPGYSPAQNTLGVLLERGISMMDHQSRPVSLDILEQNQLILTMERGHKEALQAAFPHLAEKIFLVTEMIGEFRDIVDPVGLSWIDYEDTAQELEAIFSQGFERICELADSSEDSYASKE